MRKKPLVLQPLAGRETVSCFSCGQLMHMLDELAWSCDACQVMEEHRNYVSHLREKSGSFYGEIIRYLDHGKGNYPSPA